MGLILKLAGVIGGGAVVGAFFYARNQQTPLANQAMKTQSFENPMYDDAPGGGNASGQYPWLNA